MITPDIQVLEEPVKAFTEALLDGARGGGHVALTGGSTPRAAYERAAGDPQAFTGAHVWFGDERCVAPDDERSNYGMAREALLDSLERAGVALGGIHRMQGELGPHAGAEAYHRQLEETAEAPEGPEFDLILLGIGPDGHICSMFPSHAAVSERERPVVGVDQAGFEPYVPRITFTFPTLARARRVVLMATGEGKAQAVRLAFGDGEKPRAELPASMLVEHVSSLTVLLDREAAAQL